jgi:hypothetical protein
VFFEEKTKKSKTVKWSKKSSRSIERSACGVLRKEEEEDK